MQSGGKSKGIQRVTRVRVIHTSIHRESTKSDVLPQFDTKKHCIYSCVSMCLNRASVVIKEISRNANRTGDSSLSLSYA